MTDTLTPEQTDILEAVAPWLLDDPPDLRHYNIEQLRVRLGHAHRYVTYRYIRRNGVEQIKKLNGAVLIPRSALIAHALRRNNAL